MDRELISIFAGLGLLMLVLFGTIFGVCYIGTVQTLKCQSLNSNRTTIEVLTLCGKVN